MSSTVSADWPVDKLWDVMRADDFSYCLNRLRDDRNLERIWQKQRKEIGRNPTEVEFVNRWIVDEILLEERAS